MEETERVELLIERMAYRGLGIAHVGGVVCFVPETLPGETVLAEITEKKKNFWNARAVRVLTPSPDRLAEPDCRVFTQEGFVKTPGCVYDHATHEAELRFKQEQLLSFLERQAGLAGAAEAMRPAFASPKSLHYRNKVTLHSARGEGGRNILGYVGDDNETVVDIPRCPLSLEPIVDEVLAMREDPAFWRYVGVGSEVVVRHTKHDGVVVYVNRPGKEEHESLPPLTEETPVLGHLRVPARGFWQMNPEVGGALVEAAMEVVKTEAPQRFVDFYCGVGVFGLSAAKLGVGRVVGADSGRDVIRTAGANARHFALDGKCDFECYDVARIANHLLSENSGKAAMVLLDPPRAGLDPAVVQALLAHPSKTIVYISCSADTLARDLKLLTLSGSYRLRSARLFDMFPRTAHFETMTVLERV